MSEDSISVTWGRVAKVWWALTWRGVVLGCLVGWPFMMLAAIVAAGLGAEWSTSQWIVRLTGLFVSLPIGMLVIRSVLRVRFSDFRIELVSSAPVSMSSPEDIGTKSG